MHDVGHASNVGHKPRKAADRAWNQLKRKKCVSLDKAEMSWRFEEFFNVRHGEQSLEMALVLGLALVLCFLTIFPFFPFGMVINIYSVPLNVGSI